MATKNKKRLYLCATEMITVLFLAGAKKKEFTDIQSYVTGFTDCERLTRSAIYQVMKRLQSDRLVTTTEFARPRKRPGIYYSLTEEGESKAVLYKTNLKPLLANGSIPFLQ